MPVDHLCLTPELGFLASRPTVTQASNMPKPYTIQPGTYTDEEMRNFTSEDWSRIQAGKPPLSLSTSQIVQEIPTVEAPEGSRIDDPSQGATMVSALQELLGLQSGDKPNESSTLPPGSNLELERGLAKRPGLTPEVSKPTLMGGLTLAGGGQAFKRILGLPSDLLNAMIYHESGGDTRAVSSKGARGLGQLIPKYHPDVKDFHDPRENIGAMAVDLDTYKRRYKGDMDKALAAYNWGPGRVDKLVDRWGSEWDLHLPKGVRAYIYKVRSTAKSGAPEYIQQYMGGER